MLKNTPEWEKGFSSEGKKKVETQEIESLAGSGRKKAEGTETVKIHDAGM